MTAAAKQSPGPSLVHPKLGEELPVFCERCGYSLHGLPQSRCDHCGILHFHCPECGHHQPINTLRPAAQRIIGRLRAVWLVWVVVFKLNYFGWLLFAWVVMGAEWSWVYDGRRGVGTFSLRDPDFEAYICFALLAIPFAGVGRMLLLRWRTGSYVGVVLGVLVLGCIVLGTWVQAIDRNVRYAWTWDWTLLMVWTFCTVVLSAAFVWPIWVGLVRALMPPKLAGPLLEWQKALSDRAASRLATN